MRPRAALSFSGSPRLLLLPRIGFRSAPVSRLDKLGVAAVVFAARVAHFGVGGDGKSTPVPAHFRQFLVQHPLQQMGWELVFLVGFHCLSCSCKSWRI